MRHFRHKRTLNSLKRKYFWFNMNKNVKKCVDLYSTCHWVKIVRHKSHKMLQFLLFSNDSKQDWTMKFVIDLSFSKHKNIVYDSMLMIINRYIKFNLYSLVKKVWNIKNLIDAWIDEVFISFDKFVFILIDRHSLLIFKIFTFFLLSFMNTITIQYNYYSQTNEHIEKQNQILVTYLKCYVSY